MTSTHDLDAIAAQVKPAQDVVRQMRPLTAQYPGFDLPSACALGSLHGIAWPGLCVDFVA